MIPSRMFFVPVFLSAFYHSPRPVRCLFHHSPAPLPFPNFLCLLPSYPPGRKVGEQKEQNHGYLAKSCKMNTYKNRATTLVK